MDKANAPQSGKEMRTSTAKLLMGKRVRFFTKRYFDPEVGVFQDVQGRNVYANGNWVWIPDITKWEIVND